MKQKISISFKSKVDLGVVVTITKQLQLLLDEKVDQLIAQYCYLLAGIRFAHFS